MEIMRTCKTCDYNLNGTCLNHYGIEEFGWQIDDYEKERYCWELDIDYSIELFDSLPEEDRIIYETDDSLSINDLIKRIENGTWILNRKSKKTIITGDGKRITY